MGQYEECHHFLLDPKLLGYIHNPPVENCHTAFISGSGNRTQIRTHIPHVPLTPLQ